MKNVQTRHIIYNTYRDILYYPNKKGENIYIGCQTYKEEFVLRYLANILGYELNFKKVPKELPISIKIYGFAVSHMLANGSLLTLFKLICKERGIEIK